MFKLLTFTSGIWLASLYGCNSNECISHKEVTGYTNLVNFTNRNYSILFQQNLISSYATDFSVYNFETKSGDLYDSLNQFMLSLKIKQIITTERTEIIMIQDFNNQLFVTNVNSFVYTPADSLSETTSQHFHFNEIKRCKRNWFYVSWVSSL